MLTKVSENGSSVSALHGQGGQGLHRETEYPQTDSPSR